MWTLLSKALITTALVIAISELAKRSTIWGAILASLPLTSVLALSMMKVDYAGRERLAQLSIGVFWLTLPSLVLFLMLPWLLRHGQAFWLSLVVSCAATALAYGAMVWCLDKLGIQI